MIRNIRWDKSDDGWLSQLWDKLWYKIVSIRWDSSPGWLFDFITLQLLFLFDTSFDKYISIWDYGFGGKNILNLMEDWKGNRMCLICEKTFKLDEKIRRKNRRKSRAWLIKKLLNLMRKQGEKPIIYCFVRYLRWKTSKILDRKTGRKTWYLLVKARLFRSKTWAQYPNLVLQRALLPQRPQYHTLISAFLIGFFA